MTEQPGKARSAIDVSALATGDPEFDLQLVKLAVRENQAAKAMAAHQRAATEMERRVCELLRSRGIGWCSFTLAHPDGPRLISITEVQLLLVGMSGPGYPRTADGATKAYLLGVCADCANLFLQTNGTLRTYSIEKVWSKSPRRIEADGTVILDIIPYVSGLPNGTAYEDRRDIPLLRLLRERSAVMASVPTT